MLSGKRKRQDESNQPVVSSSSATNALPDDIIGILIAPYLTVQDTASLSASCKFFYKPLKENMEQSAGRKLLQHVAYGEQDDAENMLKNNPNLAFIQASVTDYSGRMFEKITVIQYAAWTLDIHMLKMLLRYVSDNKEAWDQLNDLEINGTMIVTQKNTSNIWAQQDEHEEKSEIAGKPKETVTKETSSNYDFSPLLAALQAHVDNFHTWNNNQRYYHWHRQVGGAQRNMPVHVVNEYLHPYRSFDPTPLFKEDKLPRRLNFTYNEHGVPRLSGCPEGYLPNVGTRSLRDVRPLLRAGKSVMRPPADCLCFWGHWTNSLTQRWQGWRAWQQPLLQRELHLDLMALTALCKVRTLELTELKQRLLKPAQEIESFEETRCCVIF